MYASKPIRLLSLAFVGTWQLAAVTLPVVFERGIADGEYVARVGSGAVMVRSDGVRFDSRLRLRFLGAQPIAGALEGPLPGVSSYFAGSTKRVGVAHHERLRFRGVYPGVDVVFYGSKGRLEYDFVVGPGADLSRLLVTFEGGLVALTGGGDLEVGGGELGLLQRRPRVFQDGQELASRYRRVGDAFAIDVAGRDAARGMVIDPVIESSTYFGGGSYETARALKLDSQGNVYLAGQAPTPGVFSGLFPAGNNSGVDVALIKFSPSTNTILYYVFIGGDQDDIVNGLAVDGNGAAYLAGSTRSVNFPVSNGFQMSPGGGGFTDGFVAKVAADGKSLSYASYLGGSGSDEAFAIAVDSTGAAYVGGSTGSRNFPVQGNAFQATFGGSILNQSGTGFLAVIGAGGNRITYATLLGGSRQEQVRTVALDASNNVYAGGNTSSADFPVRGGVQAALPGVVAGFVAKLSPDLSQLTYSTYVGGRSTTSVSALVVDGQGSAVAGGYTSSTDFPVKLAPQDRYGGGDRDGFVVRLNAAGGDYLFATYLGGSDVDTVNDLTLEASGMLTVVGGTASADFPQRNGLQAFQGKAPSQDAFAAKFFNNSLVFSTLIGGAGDDQAFGVQADATGATYLAGVTASADFPMKGSPYQGQFGGGAGDMFLVKLSADASLTGSAPSLNVSPTVLNFVAAQGAAAPAAAGAVAVTAVNGGTSFTVEWSGGSWLSANPARGDAPATINVFTNQAGLGVGVYTGAVRIIPAGGAAPIVVSVTLTVANPAPVILSVNPARVPAGSPDTEFTLTGSGFTGNTAVQVSLDDGSLAQTLTAAFVADASLRFTVPKSLLFRDTLLQVRVKDPGSPVGSNTVAVQVGDRFPTIASIANAASGGGDAIAAGEYVMISGASLGPAVPLRVLIGDGSIASSSLGGVRVLFDGVAAPLLRVIDQQVVAVAPWVLAGKQTTQVVVEYLGVRSNAVAMPVTGAAPAMFTADGSGTGQGLIFNDSGLSNAAFGPAVKGSVISLYFTGGGVMSPAGVDGKIAGSAGNGPVLPVGVTMDGLACEVVSVGNALGEVTGMVQASVRIPAGVRSGTAVPIQVTVGNIVSQPGVVLSIQ